MKHFSRLLTVVSLAAIFAPAAIGHFKLLEPPSALMEGNNGDPQKMAPCGGTSADAGTPSRRGSTPG